MTSIQQAVFGATLILLGALYANAMGLSPEAGFAITAGIVGIVWTSIAARRRKTGGKGCA